MQRNELEMNGMQEMTSYHLTKVCSDQQKNVFEKMWDKNFISETMKARINEKKNTEFFRRPRNINKHKIYFIQTTRAKDQTNGYTKYL